MSVAANYLTSVRALIRKLYVIIDFYKQFWDNVRKQLSITYRWIHNYGDGFRGRGMGGGGVGGFGKGD